MQTLKDEVREHRNYTSIKDKEHPELFRNEH